MKNNNLITGKFKSGLLFGMSFICLYLFLTANSHASDYTFTQAWTVVQSNNDGFAASRANRQKAQHMISSAKSLYMPQISLSGSYTRLDSDVTLSPSQLISSTPAGDELNSIIASLGAAAGIPAGQIDDALTSKIADNDVILASLNAVWPIYTGGRIGAAQDIALGQLKETEYLIRIEKQSLFEKLVKVYFGTVLTEQVLEARVNAEKGLYKHLDHAKKLEEQGQIARVERLKAEASYDKAKVDRNKAQRNAEMAQIALNKMLKDKDAVVVENDLFVNKELPDLNEMITATLNNHPGLGVLEAKRLQAKGLIDVQQGSYLPEMFLFGNYSLYEQDDLASELAPDWMAGIGVNIPLTTRNGRSGKLKAAKSSLLQVDHLKAQAVQDLSLLVEKTWREALVAQEEYSGLTSSLALAYENINMREKAFSQGLSTSLEVVDAELFLVSITTQRQVASYRYVLSLARLLGLSNQMATFAEYQKKVNYE